MKMEDVRLQFVENAKWITLHLDEEDEDFKFLARLLAEVTKVDERDPEFNLLDVIDGLSTPRDKLEAVGNLLRLNQNGLTTGATRGIGEIVLEAAELLDDIIRDASAAHTILRAKKSREKAAEVAQ